MNDVVLQTTIAQSVLVTDEQVLLQHPSGETVMPHDWTLSITGTLYRVSS